jgi:hypothetical protein
MGCPALTGFQDVAYATDIPMEESDPRENKLSPKDAFDLYENGKNRR